MTFQLKELIAIIIAIAAAIGSFAVAQYRINDMDDQMRELRGQPLKLAILDSDVHHLKCEIGNVKRLLKQQPETDC